MANLYFEAQLDADQLRRELRDINQRFANMANNAQSQGDKMDATMKKVGAAMAGYFSLTAAQDFIGQVVNVRGEFQQLDIALQTMLGNKAKADALMANVVQLAAKTPFSLTELGQGAKQLLAFKTPAEEIPDTLKRIGDVAAGVSVPVGDLIAAYGKVSAKGKMQAEELNQFAERGVPIISELAKVIGTTDDKIYKMAETGQIGFAHLQQAVKNMTNETGMFYNLMDKQSGSLTGQLSNLGDAWDRMLNDIGKSNEGVISDVIGGLTNMVDNYEDILKVLGVVVATYGAYRGAIMLAAMAQKAALVSTMIVEYIQMGKAVGFATANQLMFNRASLANPYALAIAGIAALVGGLMLFGKEIRSAEEGMKAFQESVAKVDELNNMEAMITEYENLSEKVGKSTEEQARYNELIKILGSEYDTAISKTNEYGEAVELAGDKLRKAFNLSKEDQVKSIQDQVAIAQKAIAEAEGKIKFKQQETRESYKRGDATYTTTPESREKAKEALRGMHDEIAKNIDIIDKATIKLGVMTGKIPNYFSKYASLLVDVGNLTKDKLTKLQGEIGSVMSTDIKDPQFKERLNEQSAAISKALEDIKLAESNANAYDGKDYRKKLGEKGKSYEDYAEAMKDPRANELNALKKHYASLKAEGDDYNDFLLKQLEIKKGNTDAIAAIYQAAAKADISLNQTDKSGENMKPMVANNDPANVQVKASSEVSKATVDYAKMAKYIQKCREEAEKLKAAMKAEKLQKREDMSAGFIDAANAMGQMASFAGQLDAELGKSLQTTADMVGNIGNLMSADPMTQITGAIGMAQTVYSQFFDTSAKKQEEAIRAAEAYKQRIDLQNESLEYQIELMNNSRGEERAQEQQDVVNTVDKDIAELEAKLKNTKLQFKDGSYREFVTGTFESVKELQDALLNGGTIGTKDFSTVSSKDSHYRRGRNSDLNGLKDTYSDVDVETLTKELNYTIVNYDDVMSDLKQLDEYEKTRQELYEQYAATNADSITDSIIDGFRNGESAAQNLADVTKEKMKEALIEAYKNQIVMKSAEDLVDKMGAAMMDGNVTNDEVVAIQTATQTAAEAAEKGMQIYQEAFKSMYGEDLFASEDSAKESGMAGSIRAEMTEETASRLAGLFNVMSLDTRSMRDNMTLNLANNVQQLNQLLAIELNTGKTAANTGEAVAELKNAVAELRKVSKNTSSNIRGEG